MRSRKPRESMGAGLKIISRCPLCKASYDPLQARILSERDDAHLVHVSCRKCANAVLALIFVSNGGVSSIGLITDCSYDDVVRFKGRNEVHIDDAIAFHSVKKENLISELVKIGA